MANPHVTVTRKVVQGGMMAPADLRNFAKALDGIRLSPKAKAIMICMAETEEGADELEEMLQQTLATRQKVLHHGEATEAAAA
jgi:hypothetical protein